MLTFVQLAKMTDDEIKQKFDEKYSDKVISAIGGPGDPEGAQLLEELRHRTARQQAEAAKQQADRIEAF